MLGITGHGAALYTSPGTCRPRLMCIVTGNRRAPGAGRRAALAEQVRQLKGWTQQRLRGNGFNVVSFGLEWCARSIKAGLPLGRIVSRTDDIDDRHDTLATTTEIRRSRRPCYQRCNADYAPCCSCRTRSQDSVIAPVDRRRAAFLLDRDPIVGRAGDLRSGVCAATRRRGAGCTTSLRAARRRGTHLKPVAVCPESDQRLGPDGVLREGYGSGRSHRIDL